MHIPLLSDIVVILGLGIVVLFACLRMHIPAIVGFLLTGVIAGPHGFGLISAVSEVEAIAELGVVLLLFTIGLEFSMKNLLQLKRLVLLGGSFQVVTTLLAGFFIALQFGLDFGRALFTGCLVSLSSTAIVLKVLEERSEMESPHGKISLAILILQDIVAVPMVLMTPLMAGSQGDSTSMFLALLLKGIAIVALAIISARLVVPHILFQIAKTRSRELFLIAVVVICLSVAWATSSIGLSLALGAFLAGLIISESEYNYQALGTLLPFRDLFTSIFFISIGMLVDTDIFVERPWTILAGALGVAILKTLTAGGAAAILRYPLRTMVLSGLALNQIGEFSFILSRAGMQHGLISGDGYQVFLGVSVLTMAATPFFIASGPRAATAMARMSSTLRVRHFAVSPLEDKEGGDEDVLQDHLLVVGFGVSGRNVARAAKVAGIPYRIIEMNPVTVRKEKAKGERIAYGDASQGAVLDHAGVQTARVMVVAIPDPIATRMAVASGRGMNPRLHIIARTRFLQEMKPLYALGANEVVPEDFETSVEIFSRVLTRYFVPRDEIEKFIGDVRSDGYGMFRTLSQDATAFCRDDYCNIGFHLPDVEIWSLRVQEGAPIAGKTIGEVELRKHHGVTVLAVRRNSETIPNPGADTLFMPEDVSIVVGSHHDLANVKPLFSPIAN